MTISLRPYPYLAFTKVWGRGVCVTIFWLPLASLPLRKHAAELLLNITILHRLFHDDVLERARYGNTECNTLENLLQQYLGLNASFLGAFLKY